MPTGTQGEDACRHAEADVGVDATRTLASFNAGLDNLPALFLRHWPSRSISFKRTNSAFNSLKRWGRARFTIVGGQLYFSKEPPHTTWGCVLRRTPMLAWALLEVLRIDPQLPDVDLPINCRDKPTFWVPGGPRPKPGFEAATTFYPADGHPVLAFSYTTGRAFTDVPMPDYSFWGLPYAEIPPWDAWLSETQHYGEAQAWNRKLDRGIWVGSGTHPLRKVFQRCKISSHVEIRSVQKEEIEAIAWNQSAPRPRQWTHLREQCKYRYIIHLPGVSDWLDHFKHQLACGSVNIFLYEDNRRQRPVNMTGVKELAFTGPPASFQHFDLFSPLLEEGRHFVTVKVPRGGLAMCTALHSTLERLRQHPREAACIARRGWEVSHMLSMDRILRTYSKLLRAASLRQEEGAARKVVHATRARLVSKRNYFAFVPNSSRPFMEVAWSQWHSAVNSSADAAVLHSTLPSPHSVYVPSGLFT